MFEIYFVRATPMAKLLLFLTILLACGQRSHADETAGTLRSQCAAGRCVRRPVRPEPRIERLQLERLARPDHVGARLDHFGAADLGLGQSLKIPIAFIGWYLLSIFYSIMNKEVLNVWKFPCIFSAVQLLVGAVWIGVLWTPLPTFGLSKRRFASLREPPKLSMTDIRKVSVVAFWLAAGHVLSTVAPAYGTVAFTNVVKTLEPLFTCLFSFLLLGQLFAPSVYLSLLPVIGGVAVASASEVAFSAISLFSGLASNVCFA